ncbi:MULTISPECIES: hypothetical protein [unclassified Microbacterium]|uniref:hypothetical protein n=1 Tax=unclassified Microbacterium TaxID=2609290 RepID=UPI0012FD0E96|nr:MULTISPECIES: hypothetical protein [unclassified Microbacterium]
MTTPQTPRRSTGLPWAIAGGVVLVGGIAALVAAAIINTTTSDAGPRTSPPSTSASGAPSAAPPTQPTETGVVDDGVTVQGWVPEPITRDEDVYIRAALAAAATFDTTLATRDEWLAYLDTWFTPDTRYASGVDREAQLDQARLELRQSVVLPEDMWNSLAAEDGRVEAAASAEIAYSPVPENPPGDMFIGEADVLLTFTSKTEGAQETSYEQTARVRVQVLCGGESIPTLGSAQQVGDCKVVRFFGADGS